ncbi:MAG: 23S rRNA pseudouridine(955/2504/2580) synthase RluC [Gammaproteobacteria bacterium]
MKSAQQDISSTVQFVEIGDDDVDRRLDNFLIARLKGVPKSKIYRIVRKGEVRVNKGRADIQYRLCAGDIVRIPPIRTAPTVTEVVVPRRLQYSLEQDVLYEDDALLVLNKPAGYAVHGGSGLDSAIIEGLRKIRPDARFLELVHRLDKATSGCLIIAKKRSALRKLHELFRGEGIQKTYRALLIGRWSGKKQTVTVPLQKNVGTDGDRKVVVSHTGKPSETVFSRIKLLRDSTLVEASPKTGRTHQIRVHAAWLGHPIIGDERYGDFERNRTFAKQGFKRLLLHAYRLEFLHPVTGQPVVVTAPMPEAFERFIDHEESI